MGMKPKLLKRMIFLSFPRPVPMISYMLTYQPIEYIIMRRRAGIHNFLILILMYSKQLLAA